MVCGGNAMCFVVRFLDAPAAALCFFNRQAHGICYGVCVHNYMPFGVSGGAANGLYQGKSRNAETLLYLRRGLLPG